jgi:hypothetical protein
MLESVVPLGDVIFEYKESHRRCAEQKYCKRGDPGAPVLENGRISEEKEKRKQYRENDDCDPVAVKRQGERQKTWHDRPRRCAA